MCVCVWRSRGFTSCDPLSHIERPAGRGYCKGALGVTCARAPAPGHVFPGHHLRKSTQRRVPTVLADPTLALDQFEALFNVSLSGCGHALRGMWNAAPIVGGGEVICFPECPL